MSQGLEVYLVREKQDLMVFGRRRRKQLDVLQAAGASLEALDEQFFVEAEGLITHAEALKEIFAGKLTRESDCGFVYGHAYEIYCGRIGQWLNNGDFSRTSVEWFDTLDAFFERCEVPLRFNKLLFEQFPIPVDTDATPCGGFWEHEEIVRARNPLEAALARAADADVAGAVRVVLGWLNEAIKTPGSVVVGFFD